MRDLQGLGASEENEAPVLLPGPPGSGEASSHCVGSWQCTCHTWIQLQLPFLQTPGNSSQHAWQEQGT